MVLMKRHTVQRRTVVRLSVVVVLVLVALIILPQAVAFQTSLVLLGSLNVVAVAAAVLCLGLTFLFAALNYYVLALKPVEYHRTVFVSVANMFTNRLLPAGTGSIATFFLYLRRNRHTATQAGSVIAANNVLGLTAHAILLLTLLVFIPEALDGFSKPELPARYLLVALAVAAAIILLVGIKRSAHRKIANIVQRIMHHLTMYRQHPLRIFSTLLSSMSITILNALVLWFCCLAVAITISPLIALVVFTVGIVAGTLTPTPGGIGGAEAGLLAGLVGFGVTAERALAAVILYRLLSYWLTLVIGAAMYAYINKRGYLYVTKNLTAKLT